MPSLTWLGSFCLTGRRIVTLAWQAVRTSEKLQLGVGSACQLASPVDPGYEMGKLLPCGGKCCH